MTTPRVVLDSNCLVSALLFAGGRLAALRMAWQSGIFIPLLCKETAAELIRVLAYPKFHLDENDMEELLDDLLPYAESVQLPRRRNAIDGLKGASDAVFIHLARHAQADRLVSGDKHLLNIRRNVEDIRIVDPAEFLREIHHSGGQ